MSDRIYWINGKFVREQDAQISALDLAVLRGIAVFDSMRTYGGRLFQRSAHVERLARSAALLGIDLPWSHAEISRALETVMAACPFPETSLRILVTGGVSEDFFTPSGPPSLIIIGLQLDPYPEEIYKQGIRVATARLERFMPAAKSTNYVAGQIAVREAKKEDPAVQEVLYVNRAGEITEAVTSNVFAVISGCLVTPESEVLPGITRQVVIEISRPVMPVEVGKLSLKELYAAEEVFITGSKKEVMPVAAVDGRPMPSPVPGSRTQQIMERFRRYVEAYKNEPLNRSDGS